jgi:phosphoserine aminotransferase
MFHRTFNPGPSQVSEAVKADLITAGEQNIVGISHRSDACRRILESAASGLRRFFKVPDDYHIIFTGSATEAMELTVRNLVQEQSFHFTNGHFSELFAKVSGAYGKQASVYKAEWGQLNDFAKTTIPKDAEIITLTYNETSTGVSCSNKDVRNLYKRAGDAILVVDITSAAGCVPLEIDQADVWLFSVQKGMGLPSGLGIIFLSPRALERSKRLKHAGLFNFQRMAEQSVKHETIQTPNVLGIYLLGKQLDRWNAVGSETIFHATKAKAELLGEFIGHHKELDYFVKDPKARSQTVMCIEAAPQTIQKMHQAAKAADLVLGSGYGKLKDFTCRIATFPALTLEDNEQLIAVLEAGVF